MGDSRFSCSGGAAAARESFGIEAGRILDACRDRDCFEDVRVFLTGMGEDIIARTSNVRVKCADITGSYIGVDPVQFNRGFYSVTIKFYVSLTFEACVPMGQLQEFEGVAVIEKRVVLYGGESNVCIYRSSGNVGNYCTIPEPICGKCNTPEAVVEVVPPIVLGARVTRDLHQCRCCCCPCDIPPQIVSGLNGTLVDGDDVEGRYLTVSLGLFSVIRLVRDGQFLIDAREYCIPDKECITPDEEDPCGSFRKMPFPTSEFCPPSLPLDTPGGRGGRCGCSS